MPIRRGNHSLQNFTTEINKMPRLWGKIGMMGLFSSIMNETTTTTTDVIRERLDVFGDARRGADRSKVGEETRQTFTFDIPFFPLDSKLTARDVQDLRAAGTANSVETVAMARMRIMNRLRNYHMALKEKVMAEAIQGMAYVPNQTTTRYNYYTVYGQTQRVQNFQFSSSTFDVLGAIDSIREQIRDNSENTMQMFNIAVLANPTWFDAFINHAQVKGAYNEYVSNTGSRIDPNRDRPGMNNLDRDFIFQGIHFYEYSGAFGNTAGSQTPLFPVGEAFAFPMGVDSMFELHYAPADTLDSANTLAQELYMFEERDFRSITVESETAVLGLNHRPELVVRLTHN